MPRSAPEELEEDPEEPDEGLSSGADGWFCDVWRFFDGTKSWLAVGGPLDAGGAGTGRGCIGCRMVAADDCGCPPEGPGAGAPDLLGVGVRTVAGLSDADADEPSAGPPTPVVGIARVPSDADEPAPPSGVVETVGRSGSVPFPAPPRFAEPEPVPVLDT